MRTRSAASRKTLDRAPRRVEQAELAGRGGTLLEDGSRVADPLAGLKYRAAIGTLAEFGWPEAYRCAAAGWIPILAVSAANAALTSGTFVVHRTAVQIVCALLAAIGATIAASLWTGRSWERPARDRLRILTAHDPNRASVQVAVAQEDVSRACRAPSRRAAERGLLAEEPGAAGRPLPPRRLVDDPPDRTVV